MSKTVRLLPGMLIRCPHCRAWHPVIQPYRDGTEYAVQMMFFVCASGTFYAGQLGDPSRQTVQPPR